MRLFLVVVRYFSPRRIGRGIVASLTLLCGCSGGNGNAVASNPDLPSWARVQIADPPPPGTFVIDVLSEPHLMLGVGEESIVTVRATDMNDDPVDQLRLSFALVGMPKDAGLEKLDATTDKRGIARNTLITGEMSATFAIRISTPGAEDATVFAAVSGAGFGSLVVSAPYDGKRQVAQRMVFAQPFVDCKEASKTLGVQPTPVESKSDEAIVTFLPAGVDYAVVALAEGKSGTAVAQGCTDGIRVSADAETTVEVEFGDEPFKAAGQFNVKVALDAKAPAKALADTLQNAARAHLQRDQDGNLQEENAEGRFLLDCLEQTLNDPPYAEQTDTMALASAIDLRRTNAVIPTPESSLQAWLGQHDTGPLATIDRIASETQDSLSAIQLFAAMTLDASHPDQPVIWQARRIQARPIVTGGSPPSIDLARLRVAAETEADFLADEDLLELSSVNFRAELGALGAEVLGRVVGSISEGDEQQPDPFGCMALGTWLVGPMGLPMASACDADCLRATCDRGIARIEDAAKTALLELDRERPSLILRADLALYDDDGDLIADSMDSNDVSGKWARGSGSGPDAISGSAVATAITDSASPLP